MTMPSAIASQFFIVKSFSLILAGSDVRRVELPAEALDYHAWQSPPLQNGTRFKMDLLCCHRSLEKSAPSLRRQYTVCVNFTSNDAELFYTTVGRGTGSLVLLHPTPCDHRFWLGVVDQLAGKYRVILPDLRGHGQSEAGNGPITIEKLGADVERLLDALRNTARALCRLLYRRIHALRVMARVRPAASPRWPSAAPDRRATPMTIAPNANNGSQRFESEVRENSSKPCSKA